MSNLSCGRFPSLPKGRGKSVALVAAILCCASAQAEERFALLIGANAGWSNDRPLRHAETDAERVRNVLVELGGFPADRTELLRDPTTADVRASLRRLAAVLRGQTSPSLVVVYYSGHADERFLHLRGETLSLDEVYETLRDLPATVRVGIFDACRSGSIIAAKGGRPVARFEVKVVDDLAVSGVAVLTSSGADELAQETRTLAGSVFTHHLVSGLRGAADANHDAQVTLAEAYRYAHARTEADTAGSLVPQRPAFRYELRGQGEVVLTHDQKTAATLVLPRGDGERYVVVDPNEWQLFAEARTTKDHAQALELLPGAYHVKQLFPDRLGVAEVSLSAGQRLEVASLAFSPRPLSAGLLKGRPLDSDPEELRLWQRGEALRLLASDEAGAALAIFDKLLAARPDDRGSLRGRGRALVRLAEAYARVGDHEAERKSLKSALSADPSLSEDPDFQSWYRRLAELEAVQQRQEEIHAAVEEEIAKNPRLLRKWGVGGELISTRGAMGIVGNYIYRSIWFPSVMIDLPGPGLDLSLRLVPISFKWSPFIGAGAHVGLRTPSKSTSGGLTTTTDKKNGTTPATSQYGYDEIFSRSAHVDVGIQYFGPSGFATEFGLGLIVFPGQSAPLDWLVLPQFNAGWYF